MSPEMFQTPAYLRRYYAGQVIVGLLASPNATPTSRTPEGQLNPDFIKRLAEHAFAIADEMVKVASETEEDQ